MSTYVGIDQSLRNTGVCRLDADGTVTLTTIQPGKRRGTDRLRFIRAKLAPLIKGAALVAFEDYAYDKALQAHQLGEVGATLKLFVEDEGIAFIAVSPPALKKFATGNSKATKEMMVSMAPNARDDHQADAYALACVARLYASGSGYTTRAQFEVVHHLKNKKPRKARRARKLLQTSI